MNKLFAIFIFLVCLLTGCANDGMVPVTDAQREQIKKDYSRYANHDLTGYQDVDERYVCGMPYYGTYNGYIILYSRGQTAQITSTKIGKHVFMHGTGGCRLLAYRDGQFNQLEDVYESGEIGDKDLSAIAETHRTFDERG